MVKGSNTFKEFSNAVWMDEGIVSCTALLPSTEERVRVISPASMISTVVSPLYNRWT